MNHIHYDYIRQQNDRIIQSILLEKDIQALQPRRASLRVRLLFLFSDILLGLGAWIRPDELRVLIHEPGVDDCTPIANCS